MAHEEDFLHPKGFLRPCLLLLLLEGPTHGYELNERLKPLGGESGPPGRVYRTLRRMEEEHLLRSRWDTSRRGPARKVYELTPAGRGAVEDSAAMLKDVVHKLSGYLIRHRDLKLQSKHNQLFEVLVEARMLVRASNQASARRRVEDAFAEPLGLCLDLRHHGPVWVYEATPVGE